MASARSTSATAVRSHEGIRMRPLRYMAGGGSCSAGLGARTVSDRPAAGADWSRAPVLRYSAAMIFEEIRSGGCCSYVIACGETCSGVVVDPELSQIDRTLGLIAKTGIRVHYVVDTHTHADHFSAARELSQRLGVPRVMHRASIA